MLCYCFLGQFDYKESWSGIKSPTELNFATHTVSVFFFLYIHAYFHANTSYMLNLLVLFEKHWVHVHEMSKIVKFLGT